MGYSLQKLQQAATSWCERRAGAKTTRRSFSIGEESGRILLWAIVGIVTTIAVVLALIAIARVHVLRNELAHLTDTAALNAVTQLDSGAYYQRGLERPSAQTQQRTQRVAPHIDESQAAQAVNTAIANTRALNPANTSGLRDIHIKSLWLDADANLHLELGARAVIIDIVPGFATITVPLQSSSFASLITSH